MSDASDSRRLSRNELEAVHKSLIEVTRKQKSTDSPVDVWMPDGMSFWDAIGQLLQNMEAELSETIREEGMTAKAQLLSRRLGVARTCVRDLTRIRLVAFTRHAVISNLLSSGNADGSSAGFQRIEWNRHDPAERVFYNGVRELTEKYKFATSWSSMLGSSEPDPESVVAEVSETLMDFTEEAPAVPAPKIQPAPQESHWEEPDFDEEDRIRAMDDFPEHATSTAESRSNQGESQEESDDLVRIKVLKDVEDPIMMEDGSEVVLEEGDVEFCPTLIAEVLISAGLAEAAPV